MTIDPEALEKLNRFVDEFALGAERRNRSLFLNNLILKHVPDSPPQ